MDDSGAAPLPVGPPFRLLPFHGLRLRPARVGNPAAARWFGRSHRDLARRLQRWERTGDVRRDPVPALHVHEYTSEGLTVRGVVGALDLSRRVRPDAAHVVMPHEATHPEQVRELAARMRQTGLNPAPILLVHRGGGRVAERLSGVLAAGADEAYRDRSQQEHRLWTITDPGLTDDVGALLADAVTLIADGHHRYAAYLALQAALPGTGWDRGLVMVVDQDDTPLHLGAIHRHLRGVDGAQLAQAVALAGGSSRPGSRAGALAALSHDTVVSWDGRSWFTHTLPVPGDDLAVCRLHASVVPRLTPAPAGISYHHDVQGALDATRHGGTTVLLPAAEIDVVLAHGRRGGLLPEKATSFQPKPSLGVLMRAPADDEGGGRG
jgi:hypothetical protein